MVVFFWYIVKVTYLVYVTVNVYRGQLSPFYKVPENHGHVKLVKCYDDIIIFVTAY